MEERGKVIRTHRDLAVYRMAFGGAMRIFEETRVFPAEERYSLTDQICRSSRSVAANLAEAWRRRRYQASFVQGLNRCEAEAAESQVWLEFAVKCGYLDREKGRALYEDYDQIIGKLVYMINHPEPFLLHGNPKK